MKLVAAAVALMGALPALAPFDSAFGLAQGQQEDARFQEGQARQRASEIRLRCSSLLAGMEGVTGVNVAGSGTDYRLILVVRDLTVKMAVREQMGGDAYDGLKVIWSVTNPNAVPAVSAQAPVASSATLTSPLYEAPTLKAAPSVLPSFKFAPAATALSIPQTIQSGSSSPATVAVETRRTFWAGPGTATPRRSRYAAYASCMPSRHAIWAAQCTPTTAPTYGYSYPQGNLYRPAGSCSTQYGYGSSHGTPATYGRSTWTQPSYAYSRPGVTCGIR